MDLLIHFKLDAKLFIVNIVTKYTSMGKDYHLNPFQNVQETLNIENYYM